MYFFISSVILCCYNGRNEFLESGESIIMISKLKRLQKLGNKKVQLILTDKPKLICVDPSKMTAKNSIIWSDHPRDISVQVINPSHFKISTVCFLCYRQLHICFACIFKGSDFSFCYYTSKQPKKVLSFEDAKARALQWKKAIENLQQHS